MKRSTRFKLDVLEAFTVAIEREIKKAELEFDDLKTDDFKDPSTREKYGELMMAIAEARLLLKAYKEAKELGEEYGKEADKNEKKEASGDYDKSIGFMKFKEAA